MLMPMMRIRVVRMLMFQGIMAMRVRVFAVSTRNLCAFVLVLMMLIMYVLMLVFQTFVSVLVPVMFGEVQPHTDRHECASNY